jgi:Flp pilus assembly pilin Flp
VSKLVLRFLKDNSRETAIETAIKYGLMAIGIAVAIIVAMQLTGAALQLTFDRGIAQ